jgi:high-affinity iron transporter
MSFKIVMTRDRQARRAASLAGLLCGVLLSTTAAAAVPEPDAATTDGIRRVLTLLNVAAEEYREGGGGGKIVLPVEYEEAQAFFDEAEQRLRGTIGGDAGSFAEPFAAIRTAMESRADSGEIREQADALRDAISKATGVTEEVFPAEPPSASRGRALFADHCATCHGTAADGRGPSAEGLEPPPADFTDPDFMRAETPFDFYHVITIGRRNAAMPAWEEVLSRQDRWDLVSYLWTVAPQPARLAEGQGLYLAHCAGCHGATGDGRGAVSASLLTPVPPMSEPVALARKPDADLFTAVSKGFAGTPMPGFDQLLDADQRWAVVAFVRMLSLGGEDGSRIVPLEQAGEPRRLAGLLRLLADEYGRAIPEEAEIDELEYRESLILLDLIRSRLDPALAALAAHGGDASDSVRTDVSRLAEMLAARSPAGDVATLARGAAVTIEAHIPAEAAGVASHHALADTRRLLDEALEAYRSGEPQALYLVSDAYFQFEPLEGQLAARAPQLRPQVEARFLELRGVMGKPGAADRAETIVRAIGSDLDAVESVLTPRLGASALFIQSALIILREGFEVILIIGALLAYVTKAGHPHMRRSIGLGTLTGILSSLLTALALSALLQNGFVVVEALEGVTMLLASAVLFSVSYWLISKAEAEKWQRYIQGKVQRALSRGSTYALAGAAFLAVYREGVETVLFYQALLASAGDDTRSVAGGFAAGCAGLAVLYVLFQRFGKRIPIRQFFLITSSLLYYLAFAFAGRGVAALQQVGWVPTTPVAGVPHIELLGVYPTMETLLAQGVLVAFLVYAVIVTWRGRRTRGPVLDALSAEVGRLRQLAMAIRAELARLSEADPSIHTAVGPQVDAFVDRVAALDEQLNPAPSNGKHKRGAAVYRSSRQ